MDKKDLRELVKKKRVAMSKHEVFKTSQEIWKNLYNQDIFKNSKVIMSYMSFQNEVDTSLFNENVIKSGKVLLLPKIVKDSQMEIIEYSGEFKCNKLGIKEPLGEKFIGNIDMVIVPGIVFDKKGNRIGFGKGYYDRFFEKHNEAIKVAPLYDFQLFETIPSEKHDIAMDVLILKNNYLIIKKY